MFLKSVSISILSVVIVFCCYAAEIPAPTSEFYVNDFADVLSFDTENLIIASGQRMYEKSGTQIIVSTINSLEGEDIDGYSLEMARSYGIGSENEDNGMLILLAVSDREVKIEVGYGLEGDFNDAKAGRFLDEYAIPYFAQNDFDGGINNLYRAVLTELGLEEVDAPTSSQSEDESDIFSMIMAFVLFGIIVFVVMKSKKGGGGGGFYTGGTGRYYGGFGGRSSGGSGGFKGGGGSFGGGGASRKF